MDDLLTRHDERLPDCDCRDCAVYERNRLREQLAGMGRWPLIEVELKPPSAPLDAQEAAWHPHTLRFARTERLTLAAEATVQLLTRSARSDLDVLASMRDAVTAWVTEIDSGKALLEYSGRELNIGDLLGSDAFDDAELRSRLEERGLRVAGAAESVPEHTFAYDTALVNVGYHLSGDEWEPDEAHEASEL